MGDGERPRGSLLDLDLEELDGDGSLLGFLGAIALRKVDEHFVAFLRTVLILSSPEIYLEIYSSFDKRNKCN